LEVKLIADVGIIGKPNAGKSTLLATCSRARPKVADYPFTTVAPVLGVVETRREQFVMVDIPGLLEGAHKGVGLGTRFLRHAERTRAFVHLLDGLSSDLRGDFDQTIQELRLYNTDMGDRPQVVVVNKLDVTEVRERQEQIKEELVGHGDVSFISAATGEGVQDLLGKVLGVLGSLPRPQVGGEKTSEWRAEDRREARRPTVTRDGDVLVVDAPWAQRIVERVDLDDYRVRLQLLRELTRVGVVKALEAAGIARGDFVRFGDIELEW
jgi:GTP-binding protein